MIRCRPTRKRWSRAFSLGHNILPALFSLALAGCAQPDTETGEPVSTAEQPILNGNFDPDNVHDYSVFVFHEEGDDGSSCSGTLITPKWVLTAKHCFEQDGAPDRNVEVRLGPNAVDPLKKFFHTKAGSGKVKLFKPNETSVEWDLALVELDEPVPAAYARPLHPPDTPGECGVEFEGRQVGYSKGGGEQDFLFAPTCTGLAEPTRRISATFSTWTGPVDQQGNLLFPVYGHSWEGLAINFCDWYEGGTPGDSGGPLVREDGKLCGVFSETVPLPLALGFYSVGNRHAALDWQETIDWIESHVLDEFGCYEGECCGTPDAFNDADGDLIVDRCDLCPELWDTPGNAAQDADEDGIGDSCDLCPDDALGVQSANANLESELALLYGQLGVDYSHQLPLIREDGLYFEGELQLEFNTPQEYFATRDLCRERILPNQCDPYPAPSVELREGVAAESDLPDVPPALDCPQFQGGCDFHAQNWLRVQVPPTPAVAEDESATVGLRWCECRESQRDSRAGRTACARDQVQPCRIGDLLDYNSTGGSWVKIHTNETNWDAPSDFGKEFVLQTNDLIYGGPFPAQALFWDFLELTDYVVDNRVEGVLWVNVLGVTTDAINPLIMREVSSGYADGSASISFYPEGRRWVTVSEDIFCRSCPMQITDIVASLTNPAFAVVTPFGPDLLDSLDEETVEYFEDVLSGSLRSITASEPALQQESILANEPLLRAVAIDDSGLVRKVLVQGDSYSISPSAADYSITLPPEPGLASLADSLQKTKGTPAPLVAALSGIRRRLYILFAGQAATFDLDTSETRAFQFLPEEAPGTVLAAVYRHADGGVYFLELDHKHRLLFRRWNAASTHPEDGAVQTLLRFPDGLAMRRR